MGEAAGTVTGTDTVLAAGTVDALCDQIVSGADQTGDVLVIFGATLIVWAVVDDWIEAPGLWTVPHTVAGKVLVGGPSNAGALFVDWARALLHGATRRPAARRRCRERRTAASVPEAERRGDPGRVPVWTPYLRGERAPYHDTTLRAGLHGLDITHDADAVERAAYEASGFVIRHMLDRAGIKARRIVASGGGTHVVPWMQGMADAAGFPSTRWPCPRALRSVPPTSPAGRPVSSRRSTVPSGGPAWAAGGARSRAGPRPPPSATRGSRPRPTT